MAIYKTWIENTSIEVPYKISKENGFEFEYAFNEDAYDIHALITGRELFDLIRIEDNRFAFCYDGYYMTNLNNGPYITEISLDDRYFVRKYFHHPSTSSCVGSRIFAHTFLDERWPHVEVFSVSKRDNYFGTTCELISSNESTKRVEIQNKRIDEIIAGIETTKTGTELAEVVDFDEFYRLSWHREGFHIECIKNAYLKSGRKVYYTYSDDFYMELIRDELKSAQSR